MYCRFASKKYNTIDYIYTPLTGRVEEIIYEKGKGQEEFHHRFTYDSDYRLINSEVSRDGQTWLKAAGYEYYTHGPLKRKKLGNEIQKIDFVYNIFQKPQKNYT